MVEHVKMRLIGLDQRDGPVKSAEDREIPAQRGNGPGWAVVHPDRENVLPGCERPGQIEAERGVSTLVTPDIIAVEPDLGGGRRAIELDEQAPARPDRGNREGARSVLFKLRA